MGVIELRTALYAPQSKLEVSLTSCTDRNLNDASASSQAFDKVQVFC